MPTKDLIALKGAPLTTDDLYWARINPNARTYNEVDPTDLRLSNPSQEQLDAFDWRERE